MTLKILEHSNFAIKSRKKNPKPQTPLKGESQGKLTQQALSAYEEIFSSCLENISRA